MAHLCRDLWQQQTERNRSDRAHLRNGKHNQRSDQPVRAASVARRAVVGGLQHSTGRGGLREPDSDLDYSSAQADEDCHQLFPAELGFL